MTKTQAALEALDYLLSELSRYGCKDASCAETIRAALKAQEWRDIGTCITTDNVLLYDPEVGIVEGYWDNYNWLPVVQSQSDEYAALRVSPTHWRPLPKPPGVQK